jgi:hypothetical protein
LLKHGLVFVEMPDGVPLQVWLLKMRMFKYEGEGEFNQAMLYFDEAEARDVAAKLAGGEDVLAGTFTVLGPYNLD